MEEAGPCNHHEGDITARFKFYCGFIIDFDSQNGRVTRLFECCLDLSGKPSHFGTYWRLLVPNPLHVLEQNLLSAAVIEFRGPAVGVTSDALSGFKGAVIFQKIRDPGRPK
jgi:hypothetical protein